MKKPQIVRLYTNKDGKSNNFEYYLILQFLKDSGMDFQVIRSRAESLINCKNDLIEDKLPMLLVDTKVFQSFDFIELVLRTIVSKEEMSSSQNYDALFMIEDCKETIGKNLVVFL